MKKLTTIKKALFFILFIFVGSIIFSSCTPRYCATYNNYYNQKKTRKKSRQNLSNKLCKTNIPYYYKQKSINH